MERDTGKKTAHTQRLKIKIHKYPACFLKKKIMYNLLWKLLRLERDRKHMSRKEA